jgi:hypothetical protein
VSGDAAGRWQVGVRLDSSEVTVEEVEIAGAAAAGIEARGGDRSTVRHCFVHHNAGPGISVAGAAAPRLLDNLITGNGTRSGSPAPGVEVRDKAKPLLAGNRFEGNGGPGGPGVTLPTLERVNEVFDWNLFGGMAREQAVRAAGARPAASSPAAGAASTASAAARRPAGGRPR